MSLSYLLFLFIVLSAFSLALGDVYLQNPRGNNDRAREESTDRQNAQRLFDSENNARGGYCWGPAMSYYEGSILAVEWTSQHSCGTSNTQCNIVLQYMCSSDGAGADESLIIRDGLLTDTIPTSANPADGANYYNYKATGQTEYQYGMNEPLSEYTSCMQRKRNSGLFIGEEQVSNNQGAMATRQNAGGTRHGFECSEERDYYPYWHSSRWKDIAVLVDDKDQCGYYQKESQNVKGKNYCNGTTTDQLAANNADDCKRADGQWLLQKPWGIGKPDCKKAQYSRDNHLGNGFDGHTNSYNWTLPRASRESCINKNDCTCILRIRYNITVGEVKRDTDWTVNGKGKGPVADDPTVLVDGQNYTLALDTAQTGRGFQDRSFMFRIAPRPKGVSKDAKIYNLNVRGKRGNIVQTYPATEYDFVPTFLEVNQNDYVHFQWTGCDTNPGGNQGEGKVQTDRSNIVQIADMSKNYPLTALQMKNTKLLFKDAKIRYRMAMIDQVNCKSYADLLKDTTASTPVAVDQNDQNCMVLNAADARFDGGLVKMTDIGSYSYMSTRNNNFSNRSQKGHIKVKKTWQPWQTALVVIGGVAALAIGAAAGTVFYAKRHPLSKVAAAVAKVPGLNKI